MKIIIAALILSIAGPVMYYFMGERKAKRLKTALATNLVAFFTILITGTILMFTGAVIAAPETAEAVSNVQGYGFLAAAAAVGLGSIGAGIATAAASSAALGAISENDSIMGKALIFVALAEGIALYGLIIALLIITRI